MYSSFKNFFLLTEAKDLSGFIKKWKENGLKVKVPKAVEDAFTILKRRNKYQELFQKQQDTYYFKHPKEYFRDIVAYARHTCLEDYFNMEYSDKIELKKKYDEESNKMNVILDKETYLVVLPENWENSVKTARWDFNKGNWLEDDENYNSEDEKNFPSHDKVNPTWCVAYKGSSGYWRRSYGCADKHHYRVFYILSKKSYNHRWAIVLKKGPNFENVNTENFIKKCVEEIREPLQKRQNWDEIWFNMLNYLETNGIDIVKTINQYYNTPKNIGDITDFGMNKFLYAIKNIRNGGLNIIKSMTFLDIYEDIKRTVNGNEPDVYKIIKKLDDSDLKNLINLKLKDKTYIAGVLSLFYMDDKLLKRVYHFIDIETQLITKNTPNDFQKKIMDSILVVATMIGKYIRP